MYWKMTIENNECIQLTKTYKNTFLFNIANVSKYDKNKCCVLEDGSIDSVEIKQDIPVELKTEIERVFKSMPKWQPLQINHINCQGKRMSLI